MKTTLIMTLLSHIMKTTLIMTLLEIGLAAGHGRLMEPPARNSMWRFGFVNPVNYNDNELFCGGTERQFNKNAGRCGICGDAYDDPSPQTHETGGEFGNRIISKTYVMGSVIGLEIDITANHKGFFQLKLCPLGGRVAEASQQCLDAHPLTQAGRNILKECERKTCILFHISYCISCD